MDPETLLYRQVHPNNMDGDVPTSVAFRPTEADEGKLSVYDGSLITAGESFTHWTEQLGKDSVGVWGVSVGEAEKAELSPASSPLASSPAHAHIDFAGFMSKSEMRRKAKELLEHAVTRGCLHQGVTGAAQG